MACRPNEGQQILAANRRCRTILQRMIVERVLLHHRLIKNDIHEAALIIDERKWRYAAGRYAKSLDEQIRFAET